MSLTLYEGALRALLESQEGPVGQYVQRKAQAVVDEAERKFDAYFAFANLPDMQNIGFSMDGSTAVVGYRDVGNKSRRLAAAEAAGTLRDPPLQSALDLVRNAGN